MPNWYHLLSGFLSRRKYELLLLALIQHLFIGVFLHDLEFYTRFVWVLNMLILGLASVGVFIEKGRWKNYIRNVLFILVAAMPLSVPLVSDIVYFMQILSWVYVLFFAFIFWEVIRFLVRPGYINIDIISASACGYFLLIEVCVFLMQTLFYRNPESFKGIDASNLAATYIDFVYFSAITLTSIGFGDITPSLHHTKLLTAFFGIAGQFYAVVLVGILISKFTNHTTQA